jgi:hypothetical protein
MTALVRYRSSVADRARWDGFAVSLDARGAAEHESGVAALVSPGLAARTHLGRIASGIDPQGRNQCPWFAGTVTAASLVVEFMLASVAE